MEHAGEIVMYQTADGNTSIDVKLENETVWLSLNQITRLFDRDKSVISRHISNVFREHELDRDSVVAKNATTGTDGKTYQVEYYNLDMVISIGYRVNSKRGTQFRIWANKVLKDYLVKGYAINEKRLQEQCRQLEESVEEKAANLLYFVIKNHSFSDGNKRIAAFLFVWFLEKNRILYRLDGSKRIADNALAGTLIKFAHENSILLRPSSGISHE